MRSKSVPQSSAHRPLVAGAGGGLVASIATCPLDVVKTKLQAQITAHGHSEYLGVIGVSRAPECRVRTHKLSTFRQVLFVTFSNITAFVDCIVDWGRQFSDICRLGPFTLLYMTALKPALENLRSLRTGGRINDYTLHHRLKDISP